MAAAQAHDRRRRGDGVHRLARQRREPGVRRGDRLRAGVGQADYSGVAPAGGLRDGAAAALRPQRARPRNYLGLSRCVRGQDAARSEAAGAILRDFGAFERASCVPVACRRPSEARFVSERSRTPCIRRTVSQSRSSPPGLDCQAAKSGYPSTSRRCANVSHRGREARLQARRLTKRYLPPSKAPTSR